MIRSLVVPLDGSPFGEQALPLAVSIARRAKANIQLVHVHSFLIASYAEIQLFDDSLEDQIKQRNRIYLEDLCQRLARETGITVTAVLKDGGVAEELRDHVTASAADLVVMTTHARGPMGRFWLGSVADRLVRDLPTPLLLVHPHKDPPNWQADVVWTNLLVPLDGSPLAEQILEPALQLGSLMGAEVTLLRLVPAVWPYPYGVDGASMGQMTQAMIDQVDKMHEQLRKQAQTYLEGVAQKLRARSCRVKTGVGVADHPAGAIIHQAAAPGVSAVALATHGRRGLARFFLGSVADKVIRGCTVPVLVFRPRP